MLKGINKQIIEISNPPSPYFDKIIFIVNPESEIKSQAELEMQAESLSKEMDKPPKQKITKKIVTQAVFNILLGVCAGGMIISLLNYFIK